MPQGKRKRSILRKPEVELSPMERQAKELKGLKGELDPEEQRKMDFALLSQMLEPEKKVQNWQLGKDEESRNISANVELPHSPYPFKHPATETKELDDSVRRLRQDFPGAGTARFSNLVTRPSMTDALRFTDGSSEKEKILKGLRDINDTKLFGSAYPDTSPKDNPTVYINPNLKGLDLDMTVAHELSHRNIPAIPDGRGYHGPYLGPRVGRLYHPGALDLNQAFIRQRTGRTLQPGELPEPYKEKNSKPKPRYKK